jgi:hypothetical protein
VGDLAWHGPERGGKPDDTQSDVEGGAGSGAISSYPGPYGTVTIDLVNSTTANITFKSLTNSGNIYLFGDGSSIGVNVNASSWTTTTPTGSNAGSGFSPSSFSNGGSSNVSMFGTFNQTFDNKDGFKNSVDNVSFTLTNTGGTWANAASVLINNSDGYALEAHIFVTASPANASNGALATGFAANQQGASGGPPQGPVPEPASLLLMAGLFGGLGVAGYRRKRA